MKTTLFKHIGTGALVAALTLSGSLCVSSCTDLDENTYTFADPSQFYKNEEELQSSLATVYSSFRRMAGDYYYIMKLECCTDYGQPAYTKENCNLINAWVDVNNASNSFKNTWSRAYTTIKNANTVLHFGENIEMDATEKNRVYAQARFLRAYSYFYLVRLFGGCSIEEKYISGLNDVNDTPRSSVDEVYTQIINDLKWCEDNGQLPQKGDANYDNWRVTLGAVQALMGEVYLYRASMENDNQEYLQLAKDYSWKVIESQKYDLVKPYTDLWYWFNPNTKNNIESIFELQYAPISGQSTDMHRQFGFGEIPSNVNTGAYMYHRYSPAAYRYEEYADNDVRKQVFVTDITLADGHRLLYKPEDKGAYIKYSADVPLDETQWCTTGPGNAKYYDRTTDPGVAQPCTNFYILRYSEVLLNYAEAANKLKAGDGLKQLNEVRTRAGLSELSGLSQEELDEAIFIERGKEFIGEGKIYYDELRTDRLGKRVYEIVNRGVEEKYNYFQELQFVPQKTFLWKIPQSDMDSNPALEQNPDNVSDPRYPL